MPVSEDLTNPDQDERDAPAPAQWLPTGFILLSRAVTRLESGMWGGEIDRPSLVAKLQSMYRGLSVSFGPRRDKAAIRVADAATNSEIPVYLCALVTGDDQASSVGVPRHFQPPRVPPDILQLMMRVRGGLPDRPVATAQRAAFLKNLPPELREIISSGVLVVNETDFQKWYDEEYGKRAWPSQRTSKKMRLGRPRVQNDAGLRRRICNLARDGEWDARKDTISELSRLLDSHPLGKMASPNTLTKIVDDLFVETSLAALHRRKRQRRREDPMTQFLKKSHKP